jgi:hypothetical protein
MRAPAVVGRRNGEIAVGVVDISFPMNPCRMWEWAMAIEEHNMAFVGIERDPALADLKAVRRGIGAGLQELYSHILQEKLADRIAELALQLDQRLKPPDQQKDTDGK